MKRRILHQVLPAIIMTGAAAVPVVTSAEIISHALGGGPVAMQPSSPVATLPARSTSGGAGASTASYNRSGTYSGPVVNQPYGGVQASVTISGKRITSVAIAAPQNNPTSAGINQQAVPLLRSETLQAQNANVNAISGATLTSQAYAQSLQAALAKAGSQGNAPAAGQSGAALASAGKRLSVSVHEDD